jgi:hypothetical protein
MWAADVGSRCMQPVKAHGQSLKIQPIKHEHSRMTRFAQGHLVQLAHTIECLLHVSVRARVLARYRHNVSYIAELHTRFLDVVLAALVGCVIGHVLMVLLCQGSVWDPKKQMPQSPIGTHNPLSIKQDPNYCIVLGSNGMLRTG